MILLSIRERILTIRLLEKVKEDPGYAKTLGIEVVKEKLRSDHLRNSQSAGEMP